MKPGAYATATCGEIFIVDKEKKGTIEKEYDDTDVYYVRTDDSYSLFTSRQIYRLLKEKIFRYRKEIDFEF
jgi:hypothetical protein